MLTFEKKYVFASGFCLVGIVLGIISMIVGGFMIFYGIFTDDAINFAIGLPILGWGAVVVFSTQITIALLDNTNANREILHMMKRDHMMNRDRVEPTF